MKRTGILVAFAGLTAFSLMAMPSRSELKKVQPAVNEIMSDDMQAMKAGKVKPEDVAVKAEGYARDVTDEASKFLLLKGAFGLYVQGGKYEEALAALDRLTAAVKDVPDDVLMDVMREKIKRIPKKNGGAIFARYERISERVRCAAERTKCEKALKANPSDKAVQRKLALCLATLGDWAKALEAFAQAGGDEAPAAKAEQAGQTGEAADLWWELGEETAVFREHAATLYARVLAAGKLTGLKKALAEKRAADAAPTAEAEASAVAEEAAPTPAKARSVKKLKTMKLDLGGGVAIEMIECPAGTFTMGCDSSAQAYDTPHQVKISRPFYLSKLPLTVEQWKKLGLALPNRQDGVKQVGNEKTPATGFRPGEWEIVFETLNKKFRRQATRGYVFRPPTEAEWEYACKAGGAADDPYVCLNGRYDVAVMEQIGPGPRRQREAMRAKGVAARDDFHYLGLPCGAYEPNNWGFYDFYGNHEEVVLDRATEGERKAFAGNNPPADNWYAKEAVDPLHYSISGELILPLSRGGCGYYRPGNRATICRRPEFFVGNYQLRIALGPDLLKEKKLRR